MKIQVMQGVLSPENIYADFDCSCDSPSTSYPSECNCSCDSPEPQSFHSHFSSLSYLLLSADENPSISPHFLKQAQLLSDIPIAAVRTSSQNSDTPALHPILVPFSSGSCQKTLRAWFHLTDRCNLRCDYCYLPHHPQDMSVETGRDAVQALFRSAAKHTYPRVKIMYAGGEPLLRFPLILELHDQAQALAESQEIFLEEVVLSNGTLLTEKMVQALKTRHIRLMISLDGFGVWHNLQRPFANGKGSFERVFRAVELALANGVRPNISITVTGRNADHLAELIEWLLKKGLIFQLNFYRQSIFSQSHADLRLEDDMILAGMQKVLKVIENNLPRFSLLSILDRTTLAYPHILPCGAGADYLVFTPQGKIAQCQMLLQHSVADVNTPDPIARVRADTTHFINPPVDQRGECAECPWRYWCGGGCPLETRRVMGSPYHRSPNCRIYQTLFPELIRLEGLRLHRYSEDPGVVQTQWLEFEEV